MIPKADLVLDLPRRGVHAYYAVFAGKAVSNLEKLGTATSEILKNEKPAFLYQNFEKGILISTRMPASVADVFLIHGDIYQKWNAMGRENYGLPITEELITADGVGRFIHFTNNRSIYWHPSAGARSVADEIRQCWATDGYERSPLGYPASDEMPAGDGVGKLATFQYGTIYYSPGTGAFVARDNLSWSGRSKPGGIVAGAECEISFHRNGNFSLTGIVLNSGKNISDCRFVASIVTPLGVVLQLQHNITVDDSFHQNSFRNNSFEITSTSPLISKNWYQLHFAELGGPALDVSVKLAEMLETTTAEAIKKLGHTGNQVEVNQIIALT